MSRSTIFYIQRAQSAFSSIARSSNVSSNLNVENELRLIIRESATDLMTALDQYDKLREYNDIPDWAVVKIAAHAVSLPDLPRAQNILHDHYKVTGAERRLARKSDLDESQVVAALHRSLASVSGNTYERTRSFYRMLINMKYCNNKDIFISVFLEHMLNNNEPINKVVDELNSLYDLGRCKSLTRTLYMLATALCATDEDELSVDNFVSSRLPARTKLFFDGFIQLTKKKGIKFAEKLQIEQVKFHPEGLQYVCHLAAITKQNEVLDSLLQLRVLFHLTEKSALMVYDNLIKIVGKKGDLQELSRIGQEILDQRWKEDFLPSLSRIRHFYICKNQVPPKHIQDFLDSKGK